MAGRSLHESGERGHGGKDGGHPQFGKVSINYGSRLGPLDESANYNDPTFIEKQKEKVIKTLRGKSSYLHLHGRIGRAFAKTRSSNTVRGDSGEGS